MGLIFLSAFDSVYHPTAFHLNDGVSRYTRPI